MDTATETKTCVECGEDLPVEDFEALAGSGRRRNRCRHCRQDVLTVVPAEAPAVARQSEAATPTEEERARRRETMRRYRANNPGAMEKNRRQQAARNAAFRALRDRHRGEFDEILAAEHAARGIA